MSAGLDPGRARLKERSRWLGDGRGRQIYLSLYISDGYASCSRPLDVDSGLLAGGLAANLENRKNAGLQLWLVNGG